MSTATWSLTDTGKTHHSFSSDGQAICRKNIKADPYRGLMTEAQVDKALAESWGVSAQGYRKCTTCARKEADYRKRLAASMARSTGEGDHLPPAEAVAAPVKRAPRVVGPWLVPAPVVSNAVKRAPRVIDPRPVTAPVVVGPWLVPAPVVSNADTAPVVSNADTELALLRNVLREARAVCAQPGMDLRADILSLAVAEYDKHVAGGKPRTWVLSARNLNEVDDAFDLWGIPVKGYWVTTDRGTVVDGLKVGPEDNRSVVRYGDTITLYADGSWSVARAGN